MEDYVHRVGRTGRAGNKGTSFTFVTEEEAHYAQDIIKALENSNNPVPAEVKALYDGYLKKVRDGDIERKKVNGFDHSAGFTFNTSEKDKVKELRKKQARMYVDLPSDDEDDLKSDVHDKTAEEKEEERQRREV